MPNSPRRAQRRLLLALRSVSTQHLVRGSPGPMFLQLVGRFAAFRVSNGCEIAHACTPAQRARCERRGAR